MNMALQRGKDNQLFPRVCTTLRWVQNTIIQVYDSGRCHVHRMPTMITESWSVNVLPWCDYLTPVYSERSRKKQYGVSLPTIRVVHKSVRLCRYQVLLFGHRATSSHINKHVPSRLLCGRMDTTCRASQQKATN